MSEDQDPTFASRSPEEQAKADEAVLAIRNQELNDLKSILSTDHGRRFIWRILAKGRLHSLSFTGNSRTYFNEGERNMGLWLFSEVMEADKESYPKMLQDHWEPS